MSQVSQAITRKSASNLALAFILLPRAKRAEMSALYAFCRQVDDIADNENLAAEKRRAQLNAWREDIRAACHNQAPAFAVNRELRPIIARHHLPFQLFDELIRGVEMDLEITRYPTFNELEQYCFRVASVVGLLSIEIFGYKNPACKEFAVHLGKALQLTNILRDVEADARRGRIYLPLSDLAQFKVNPDEILQSCYSPRYFELARHIAQIARAFYARARETLPGEDRRSMATAELMASVYWRLLEELERRRFNVFHAPPARLTKSRKIMLIMRTWWRMWTGSVVPSYGAR